MPQMMRSAVFVEPGRIVLDEKPLSDVGSNDALIRITTTTICGTDVHILEGEYPVAMGLTVGHEPVGADVVIGFGDNDPKDEIMRITNDRGVDVAIEALGLQSTFESCLVDSETGAARCGALARLCG